MGPFDNDIHVTLHCDRTVWAASVWFVCVSVWQVVSCNYLSECLIIYLMLVCLSGLPGLEKLRW